MKIPKISFQQITEIVARWRNLFIIVFIGMAMLSIIVSLILPKWYKSSCKIFISSTNQSTFNFENILGNIPLDFSRPPSQEMMRIGGIITSRTFLDDVIIKYNLQDVFGQEYMFKTRDLLKEYIEIEPNFEESSLTISFIYRADPQMAAEICQYILQKINEIYSELQMMEAHNNKIYIQRVYEDAVSKLHLIEDSLKIFQEKYGTYELDQQLSATIQTQAELESNLLQTKIQYNLLKNVVDNNSPKLLELKFRKKVLEEEIKKFQLEKSDNSIFIPLKNIPEQGLRYYKLKRGIEIGSKLLEFLTPQYEQAKIKEVQSKPSFVILDFPNVPEYKYKPKRAYIVIGSTFMAMILLSIIIVFVEYFNEMKKNDPERYNLYMKLLGQFKILRKK